jgi:hypothetical protein
MPPSRLDGSAALAAANTNAQVTGADRRTLEAIFRHPLSHGLAWREVVLLINAVGAAEERHNGEFMLSVGEERMPMRRPHNKDLTAPEVMELRHFLVRAGWSSDAAGMVKRDLATGARVPEARRLIVIIDHAGARVFRIDLADDDRKGITPFDPKHMLHHIARKLQEADRDESRPEDTRFFDAIAAAVSTGGDIVVIGHGKGQSNEADHLSAHLQAHHKEAHARIVATLSADLSHLSVPELLELGRRAFAQEVIVGSA